MLYAGRTVGSQAEDGVNSISGETCIRTLTMYISLRDATSRFPPLSLTISQGKTYTTYWSLAQL